MGPRSEKGALYGHNSDLGNADEVTGRLLAIQAQDPRGARLTVRSRLTDTVGSPGASQIDEGRIVVGWLNRGTLHMVRSEDYWWLHAIMGPRQVTANRTRLRQGGVSEAQADKGLRLIDKALADGPALRKDLKEKLESAGIPVAGQALVHILYLASIRGLVVRGPMVGGEQGFVLVRDWLGERVALDPEAHLPELARRYLAGHGPAGDRDLAAWAGIPLGQARKGLEAIAGETEPPDPAAWSVRSGSPWLGESGLADPERARAWCGHDERSFPAFDPGL